MLSGAVLLRFFTITFYLLFSYFIFLQFNRKCILYTLLICHVNVLIVCFFFFLSTNGVWVHVIITTKINIYAYAYTYIFMMSTIANWKYHIEKNQNETNECMNKKLTKPNQIGKKKRIENENVNSGLNHIRNVSARAEAWCLSTFSIVLCVQFFLHIIYWRHENSVCVCIK